MERTGNVFFISNNTKGSVTATWTWLIMENMNVNLISHYEATNYTKDATIKVFYVNPSKAFEMMKVGGEIALNKAWT